MAFRPHCPQTLRRCAWPVAAHLARICMSVCVWWALRWSVQKWMNGLRWRLGGDFCGPKETCTVCWMGSTSPREEALQRRNMFTALLAHWTRLVLAPAVIYNSMQPWRRSRGVTQQRCGLLPDHFRHLLNWAVITWSALHYVCVTVGCDVCACAEVLTTALVAVLIILLVALLVAALWCLRRILWVFYM